MKRDRQFKPVFVVCDLCVRDLTEVFSQKGTD